MEEQNKRSPFIPLAAVVVIAVVVVAFAMGGKNEGENLAEGTDTTPVVADTQDAGVADVVTGGTTDTGATGGTETAGANVYEDGTYTAVGLYTSPGGPEEIGITLTINDDVITAATAETKATIPASVNWQDVFSANFSSIVVGKSLDEVSLDKVSGSSLTPKGFNDAVTKIQAQAEA